MFRRHMSPFAFSILALSACTIDPPNGTDGGGGGGAPAGAPAGTAAPPAGGAPEAGNPGQFKPEWLNERLAQAKRSAQAELLQQLGVPDAAAAAKLLADGKAAADATKSELQRKDEELAATKMVAAEAKGLRDVLVKRAAADLAKLPAAAQEHVRALAGDDPVKVLEAIELALAMAPAAATGAITAPPAAGAAKPPVPPAANTTGAAGGPPSATASPPDHLAAWKAMEAKNPMAAAHYYLANQTAIIDQQQKTTPQ